MEPNDLTEEPNEEWVVKYFTDMGYKKELVVKVVQEYSEKGFGSYRGFCYFVKPEIIAKLDKLT